MTDRVRVLLVDDDDEDALLTREHLSDAKEARFRIDRVNDADAALAALLENRHDVCLMDYKLGGASGIEVIRRAHEAGADVPVIVLTGSGDRSVDLAAMAGGASDYLEKGSIDGRVLERAIRYAMARKHDERELAERNARLERLDAEKNQLLGMAAHDLRNPLGVVYGYASVLANELPSLSPDEAREMLTVITRSTSFMRGLLDDLLDLASIEAGTVRLRVQACDPVALARRNVAQSQVIASPKSIRLHLEPEGTLPRVAVDEARFDQVLGNLLSNAVKYSPPDTDVVVRVRPDDDFVRFDVVDRGRGIAPEFLSRMFKPFTKEEATGTAGEKSTGLGLAIVKRIVDAHGGRIDVDSTLGAGSTFSVWLPAHREGGAP